MNNKPHKQAQKDFYRQLTKSKIKTKLGALYKQVSNNSRTPNAGRPYMCRSCGKEVSSKQNRICADVTNPGGSGHERDCVETQIKIRGYAFDPNMTPSGFRGARKYYKKFYSWDEYLAWIREKMEGKLGEKEMSA